MTKIEIKSKKFLDLIEKYKKELNLSDYELNVGYDFNKSVFLKLELKGNYTRLNFEDCIGLILELRVDKDKKPYVRLTNNYSKVNVGINNTNQFKKITELIDELLKINIHEFPEYIEFLKMEEKKRSLENQKQKLEEELKRKQEEIDKKLNEINKVEI